MKRAILLFAVVLLSMFIIGCESKPKCDLNDFYYAIEEAIEGYGVVPVAYYDSNDNSQTLYKDQFYSLYKTEIYDMVFRLPKQGTEVFYPDTERTPFDNSELFELLGVEDKEFIYVLHYLEPPDTKTRIRLLSDDELCEIYLEYFAEDAEEETATTTCVCG